ncbi:MAG: SET domain-containing protein-lysine N-methyltransferase [Spartobacteria bacterium]
MTDKVIEPKSAGESSMLLEVRVSRIHGHGVYAAQPIAKGTEIIEYTGARVLWKEVEEDPDDPHTFLFGLDDGIYVIDPEMGGNEARWINHSCDPNCEAIEDEEDRVYIYALRDIPAGEELFYDYALQVDEPRTKELELECACHCGSAKCRGTLLGPP